jgi:type IV pili sensor histidine kinase/response regulator
MIKIFKKVEASAARQGVAKPRKGPCGQSGATVLSLSRFVHGDAGETTGGSQSWMPCVLLCASLFLSACSTPPTLPEPEGALTLVNPVVSPALPPVQVALDKKESTPQIARFADSILLKPANLLPLDAGLPDQPKNGPASKESMTHGDASKNAGVKTAPLSTQAIPPNILPITAPVPVPTPTPAPIPQPVWIAQSGSTLREAITAWAAKAKWQVIWDTRTDYPLMAGVQFSGTFEHATGQFINLYAGAQQPLLLGIQPQQRLIYISNKKAAQ